MSTTDTELAQALEHAYAAYKRRVGRLYAMERLRHMLARDFAAQEIIADANQAAGGDDNWKCLGAEARAVSDALSVPGSKREAAE